MKAIFEIRKTQYIVAHPDSTDLSHNGFARIFQAFETPQAAKTAHPGDDLTRGYRYPSLAVGVEIEQFTDYMSDEDVERWLREDDAK